MPTALVTIPPAPAESLARVLVEERLAASVNRVDCESTYRWDGEVERAEEVLLLVNTTTDRYDDVVELVERRHPYEVAPIQRYDETDATPAFATWRRENVTDD